MAISTESGNLAWQKVKTAIEKAGSGQSNPGVVQAFKALKSYLSQHKRNPDLQFVPFTDADVTGTDGVVIADAPATVYAFYVVKSGTSGTGTATDSFVKLYDDATDDSTAGDGRVALPLLVANDIEFYISPDGLPMAAGIVATAHTSLPAATDSTAGDAGPGFVLLGA